MPEYECKTYAGSATSGWQKIQGDCIRSALEEAAKALPIDGEPVLVCVKGHGDWWIQAYSEVVYSAKPVL